MTSHENCGHPATRSARATCRRERAKAEAHDGVQRKAQAKQQAAKPKQIKRVSADGVECTAAEHRALLNILRADAPCIDSTDVCRSIREKGFATYNEASQLWSLTADGSALARMQ